MHLGEGQRKGWYLFMGNAIMMDISIHSVICDYDYDDDDDDDDDVYAYKKHFLYIHDEYVCTAV